LALLTARQPPEMVRPVFVDNGQKAVTAENKVERSASVEPDDLVVDESKAAEELDGVQMEDEVTDKEVSLGYYMVGGMA